VNYFFFVILLVSLILIQYAEGAPASSIVAKDVLGNEVNPTLNQKVFFHYDVANGHESTKDFDIDLFIILDDTNEQIFYKKQQLQLKPDAWTTITWSFTPTKSGNYTAKIIIDGISTSYTFVISDYSIKFAKSDWGEGLSTRECSERIALIPTYFEPNLDLAKFKAENHPVFKELVENKSYNLDSSGGTTVRFSNQCSDDIPAFELQYMIDKTDNSHTRIYVDMDFVSYDVLEITSRFTAGSWPDPIQSQPLPFYIKTWEEIQILGEYTNSDQPIESKLFKIPYVVTNGEIKSIESNKESINVKLTSKGEGKFALKIPRNYPYTDHDDSFHPGHGLEVFAVSAKSEVLAHVTKSDCFYDVWTPFSGDTEIEFGFKVSYLMGGSFHGDKDVPKYCLAYTIDDQSLNQISNLPAHKQLEAGIFPYDVFCKDDMQLVVRNERPACVSEATAARLWEIGWVDRSTDIYTKNSSKEILNSFQSRIISKEKAIQIVREFIDETHLKIKSDRNESEITMTGDLGYSLLSKGYLSLLAVDPTTGLPTSIMPPWWKSYYRSPQWYTELQKDYLGMEHNRVEDGHVFWSIGYRTCLNCIADYPIFFVDPIEGRVVKTQNLDSMFTTFS